MASKLLSNEFQKHICLDYECTTIEEAIHKAGDLLVQVGCVKPPYINGMIRREQETSTDIGLGVMIPHGTEDTLNFVLKPGISIVQIPHGVSYHGNTIHLVIGISSREEDSLQELMQITDILLKPEKCHRFLNASSKQEFNYRILFGNRMDSKCKTCKTDQSNLKLLTSNLNWTYWW